MITLFACPKPFHGHIGIIQKNAIKSWTFLKPKPEIILMGMEDGIAEICEDLGLIHIADVDRNEYGTPFVNSLFQLAQKRASQSIVCYINSDIILMSDFMLAVELVAVKKSKFLILGQRWDIDIKDGLDFDSTDWAMQLIAIMARNGKLHAPNGIDYFCFPRGGFIDMPPFVIGRPKWDNWLVWQARAKGVPVVDVTETVKAIHQNHEYAATTYRKLSNFEINVAKYEHDSGQVLNFDGVWVEMGPEAQWNIALRPENENLHVWAATWMVDLKGRVRRRSLTLKPSYLYYQLKCVLPFYWPIFGRVIRWMLTIRTALLKDINRRINKSFDQTTSNSIFK
jgi:hypothetical protein